MSKRLAVWLRTQAMIENRDMSMIIRRLVTIAAEMEGYDPMVHESNQIISMANAPSFWRFTPVEYKDAFLKDWPNKPFDILEVWKQVDPNGFRTITGAGLFLGPITETAGLDFDGPGTRRNFEHHFGRPPTDLTKTICSTSGRPKRMQMFYKVPKEYWRFIKYKN